MLACVACGASLLPTDPSCPECGTPSEPHTPSDALTLPITDSPAPWTDMVERLRRATLGEFEIGRELGRGGMAAVFLAHEISLARKVAIKVMSPGLLLDDGMIDRFRHEAITIAHLHHPHIVSLYSVRQAEGLHFFVMQYVQGRSLDQVIQLGGPLQVPIVRSILAQVGSALTYAHRSRVIHRDIKPANILIDGDGNAIVTDFGIAKAARTPSQTLTGALVGTPPYMSPEQCRGTEVSGASDQYSLGAVAYEMLTGSAPFSGSTLTVMQAHVERAPVPIREIAAGCPPDLEAAILRMLAKDPADRWPRMADAVQALGAGALAEDDPLRLELSRLARADEAESIGADRTPTSPTPRTRPPAAVDEMPVSGVSILPPPTGLEIGDSFVLVATVRGAQGVCLPSTAVTWSGDAPDVLRFASSGGEAIAVGVGTVLLSATCRGAQAALRVEVALPRADEIVIAPPDRGVAVGDEIRLEAVARDKRGQPIARPVVWTTDDGSTASVTGDGELAGRAPGFARITALLDDARASVSIPVLPARVAAIRVVGRQETVAAGKSFEVAATPVDRWGSPLSGRRVRWSSSDARIVVATAEGRVHTVQPGSAVLTASCEGVSESVRVSVAEAAAPGEIEAGGLEEHPRIKLRKVRGYEPDKLVGIVAGVALVVGILWFVGRPRAVSPPPEMAPTVSASTWVPSNRDPAPAETNAAAPAEPARRSVGLSRGGITRHGARKPSDQAAAAPVEPALTDSAGGTDSLDRESVVDTAARKVVVDGPVETGVAPAPMDSQELRAVTPPEPKPAPPVDGLHARLQLEARMLAGVEWCYAALKAKDIDRVKELYHPTTTADYENLKRLGRLFRTREWSAEVGERMDGARVIGADAAAMDFTIRLTWNDAFGGHLSSQPVFRAEYQRNGGRWELSSCRIVGSPKL